MNHIFKISAALALSAGILITAPTGVQHQVSAATDQAAVTGQFVPGFVRPVALTVTADGTVYNVSTSAATVHEVLSEIGLALGEHDLLSAELSDIPVQDMALTVRRVAITKESRTIATPHTQIEVLSEREAKGTKKVSVPGSDGQMTVVTRRVYVDGVLSSDQVVSNHIDQMPTTEMIIIGSKAPAKAKTVAPKKAAEKKPDAVVKKAVEVKQPRIRVKKAAEAKKPAAKRITRSSSSRNTKRFTLTYYTDLPEENGGWTITATGEKLRSGMVASNYYPIGTKIYLPGRGTVTVKDRGGSDFNSSRRLDVFVPRRSGESKKAYLRRVNNMGRTTVSGYVK